MSRKAMHRIDRVRVEADSFNRINAPSVVPTL